MATITTATYKPRIKRGSRQHIYHVESATRPGTFYTTDAYNMTCPCPAGRKGKRCWHLATAISYDAWRKAQQARAAAPARHGRAHRSNQRLRTAKARAALEDTARAVSTRGTRRMATTLAPNPSVTSDDSITDVTLTVIFSPCQPLGATIVIVEPDPGAHHVARLALLGAAIVRLGVYHAEYAEALAADALGTAEHTCTMSASGWCLFCGADARALPAGEHTIYVLPIRLAGGAGHP